MTAPQNTVQRQGQGVASADYLNSLVQWVPDVATLRGFIGINDMTIYLLGLESPNDGGQGHFYWDSAGIAPDDGVDVIVPNGAATGEWIRSPTAEVTNSVTQKQMRGWLAANGPPYIYTVDAACPADIAETVNIEWLHANTMVQGDALYLFIQTTLGFNANQMAVVFAAMQTYPQ